MVSDFIQEIKEETLSRLTNLIGEKYPLEEIKYLLVEKENLDGVWWGSPSIEHMKKYLYEYSCFVGFMRITFGEIPYFESEPVDYKHSIDYIFCQMMCVAVQQFFEKTFLDYEQDLDLEDEVEITEDFIRKIDYNSEDIEDAEDIFF